MRQPLFPKPVGGLIADQSLLTLERQDEESAWAGRDDGRAYRVLLVEQNVSAAQRIEDLLCQGGLRCLVHHVRRLREAAAALDAGGVDIVLLNLTLPDSRGLPTLRRLGDHLRDAPVVVLTPEKDVKTGLRALKLGAQEFMVIGAPSPDSFARCLLYAMERKRAEQAERRRISMESAVDAMRKALGTVAHELRTPLTAIRLLAEHLLNSAESFDDVQIEQLRIMHDETIRMSEMLSNLLESARIESGMAKWNWSAVNIRVECERAAALVRHLLHSNEVRLELELDDDDLTAHADADAIRRLVINFLTNAVKHTQKGRVELKARRFQEHGNQWIEIAVSDTGLGMSGEVVQRLGEAFALNQGVVDDPMRGTGLGLFICRAIAAAHGGAISVRSKLGEGSVFRARLRADLASPLQTEFSTSPIEAEALPGP